MNVHLFENHIMLTTEPGFVERTIRTLNQFVVTDDVVLEDVTDALAAIAIFGPQAEEVIKNLLGNNATALHFFTHKAFSVNKIECTVICLPLFGTKGWRFVTKIKNKENLWNALMEVGKSSHIYPVNFQTTEILRIEAGVPLCGVDFTEESLLLETGIESRAVSFTKGCYPGQEIVARMDSRAKFAKKLTGMVVLGDQIPNAGDLIFACGAPFRDRSKKQRSGPVPDSVDLSLKETTLISIGKVTSAVYSPKLSKPLAMGYLTRDFLTVENEIEIISKDSPPLSAKIINLPV